MPYRLSRSKLILPETCSIYWQLDLRFTSAIQVDGHADIQYFADHVLLECALDVKAKERSW